MIKVFLLSTIRPIESDTHWASPYYALKRAFQNGGTDYCGLVHSPDEADLIIICPRPRNPVFPVEIFRDWVALKYREKCVVLSTDDNPLITHKGFYTTLSAKTNKSRLLKGGFYPLVAFSEPHDPFSLATEFKYLFSFLGSFDTHPVRERLGLLFQDLNCEGSGENASFSYRVRDTGQLQAQLEKEGKDQRLFKADYLDSLRQSKFILCPRGRCPSSVRVFETMKARRVPVIISDDWVPPPEIPWNDFAVFIKECDIEKLAEILRGEESTFVERAGAARKAWDDFLAADVLPITVTRWGMSLLSESSQMPNYSHSMQLFGQLFSWRFIRRGLFSEMNRLIRST